MDNFGFHRDVIVSKEKVLIPRTINQIEELAKYARIFIFSPKDSFGQIPKEVFDRITLFHTDSVICGYSALAMKTEAPTILRQEALDLYKRSNDPCSSAATVFGSDELVAPEKAIAANCSAVREWDSNGTLFGYRKDTKGHQAGEFGHNDYYPVVIAAAQVLNRMKSPIDGRTCARAMICLDEIRGRLAEVFSLKSYKIDHVLHGSIASAIIYGILLGATDQQIDSAVGMTVSHYTPWRAIRSGKQLSDSKGASAAISTEAAIISVQRAMRGFRGPSDIFRNREAPFCLFGNSVSEDHSPFDILLEHSGPNFAIMSMHFKIGLYEHQSAGAIEGVTRLMVQHPGIYQNPERISKIVVQCYKTAVGIIGDPAKRRPTTRQSADHSMFFILASLIHKANTKQEMLMNLREKDPEKLLTAVRKQPTLKAFQFWLKLFLTPDDYAEATLHNEQILDLIDKMHVVCGGDSFNAKYPEGIPTQVAIYIEASSAQKENEKCLDSGMIVFPVGHCQSKRPTELVEEKFNILGKFAFKNTEMLDSVIKALKGLSELSAEQVINLYSHKFDF